MLALYIIAGCLTYLGVGYKLAKVDLKDSINNGVTENKCIETARTVMYTWPLWVISYAPRMKFKSLHDNFLVEYTRNREQEKEVERILESGEI